jgi:transcription-repair coupling factor (superfamily II helicase)
MATLAALSQRESSAGVVLTTINALLQRVPARALVAEQSLQLKPGNVRAMSEIVHWLEMNGYSRASTVRDVGEYAVRGGILDLYAPGTAAPVRLDFFGDAIETIKSFDPETQRSIAALDALHLLPLSEVRLTDETIKRFRVNYTAAFGGQTKDDALFDAVSQGRRHPGLEHWLPLFSEKLETLFDYMAGAPVILEPLIEEAARERLSQINDYYSARREALDAGQGPLYKPLKPDRLYLTEQEWQKRLDDAALVRLQPFNVPDAPNVIDAGGRTGRNFAPERADENINLFSAVADHVKVLASAKKRAVFAFWSEGSRDRMQHVLSDHGLKDLRSVSNWADVLALPTGAAGLAVFGIDTGFESENAAFLSEQDILGDRFTRPHQRRRRAEDFISEVTSLDAGDIVVHVDHGIGRFMGLKAIEALGASHDCLEIHYADDSRLFLPVENLDLLSRYGSEETNVQLDRLQPHEAADAMVDMHDNVAGIQARHFGNEIFRPPAALMRTREAVAEDVLL